jgi:hypothetical protein
MCATLLQEGVRNKMFLAAEASEAQLRKADKMYQKPNPTKDNKPWSEQITNCEGLG